MTEPEHIGTARLRSSSGSPSLFARRVPARQRPGRWLRWLDESD